jgi:5-formaminoimidazole-4-carboxamide-1-beta-D-ribofuranosyl 5'-monophosphate synthetase
MSRTRTHPVQRGQEKRRLQKKGLEEKEKKEKENIQQVLISAYLTGLNAWKNYFERCLTKAYEQKIKRSN